jgi:transposase
LCNIPLSNKVNLKKLEKVGNVNHKKGAGRSKKITPAIARQIGQIVRRDSTISLRSLEVKLKNKGIDVSHMTIGTHLTNLGYEKKLPQATPMLTEAHKERRIEWARKHLEDNWNNTVFTDETAFQLFRNTVERWYKDVRPVRRIPKDRTKIFAWGGFSKRGKTSLFCFTNIMNAEFYVNILENHIPEVQEIVGKRWRFQQDNDLKHTSRLAQSFLDKNVPELLDWPANSPDLNPIENLWNIVKRNVEKREPKNQKELQCFMVEEWNSIPNSMLKNLINSMRRRCELVIESNGDRISY